MKRIFDTIKSNPLFQGIAFSDFKSMMSCLSARSTAYKKGDVILLSGDTVNFVGLVLSGGVKVIKEDMNGNITILTELGISESFGEVFACAGVDHSPVTVQASEDAKILFIDYKKIITACSAICPFHTRLIENMLKPIAQKNLTLNQKIDILSKRTTREKLMSFFDYQRGAAKKFSIPYSREELAHYLCVDRSAMSNELCKMRDDGILKFSKNLFEIM
ncbi:MAG: Crp/Fnr family transcriptional regulator [Oscillospiraceae bacterium]|nr:Crp/Fnr family transcriptional regulator [Oscillospiraceae bacterium]